MVDTSGNNEVDNKEQLHVIQPKKKKKKKKQLHVIQPKKK